MVLSERRRLAGPPCVDPTNTGGGQRHRAGRRKVLSPGHSSMFSACMDTRPFGTTGLKVSELGLGCARIGGIFQRDPGGFVNLLAAALGRGITFFDTADMYSQGESETLIGRAFGRKRNQVVIASKAGYCLPAQRRWVARLKPLARPLIRALGIRRDRLPAAVRGALAQDFSPAYLRRAVDGSLRRLRTDYIDVLQLHSPPADIVGRGEWVEALEGLKRAGKIRFYGVSCDTLEAAHAALAFAGVSSLQVVVSLLERSAAETIVPLARQRGVAVIGRECLANGLLVKAESEIDLKAYCPSPEQEDLRRTQLRAHRQAAAERGVPLARLAVEYATGVDGVSVSLIGVRSIQQLNALLRDLGR
jgi:aryl-alcohol dehydrogenase-like predicted oxidoreductase